MQLVDAYLTIDNLDSVSRRVSLKEASDGWAEGTWEWPQWPHCQGFGHAWVAEVFRSDTNFGSTSGSEWVRHISLSGICSSLHFLLWNVNYIEIISGTNTDRQRIFQRIPNHAFMSVTSQEGKRLYLGLKSQAQLKQEVGVYLFECFIIISVWCMCWPFFYHCRLRNQLSIPSHYNSWVSPWGNCNLRLNSWLVPSISSTVLHLFGWFRSFWFIELPGHCVYRIDFGHFYCLLFQREKRTALAEDSSIQRWGDWWPLWPWLMFALEE